jgi:tetratricopeptide (TPR) repeat protein
MLVEENKERQQFWTRPRPWLFLALIFIEVLNFNWGPRFWFDLGVRYKDMGWTEASRILMHCSNWSNPWSPDGKRAVAYSRVRLPRNNISQAAQAKNIDAYNLDEQGRSAEAAAMFQALIKSDPNFEWPYNNLSTIYEAEGKLDEARALCQKALQINPDYANAHINLAEILRRQGFDDEAVAHQKEARKLLDSCN